MPSLELGPWGPGLCSSGPGGTPRPRTHGDGLGGGSHRTDDEAHFILTGEATGGKDGCLLEATTMKGHIQGTPQGGGLALGK